MPLGLVTTIPDSRSSGYMSWATPAAVECSHFRFLGELELMWAQGVTDKNVGVRQFLRQVIVVRQMQDAHFRPATAQSFGKDSLRTPKR